MENQNVQTNLLDTSTTVPESKPPFWDKLKDNAKGIGLFVITGSVVLALLLGGTQESIQTLESKFTVGIAEANTTKADFYKQADEACKTEIALANKKLQEFLAGRKNATREEVEAWKNKVFGENLSCNGLFS